MKVLTYPSESAEKRVRQIIDRAFEVKKKDLDTVGRILEDVKKNGDDALIAYTRQFDAPTLERTALKVPEEEIAAAVKSVDTAFKRSLNRAAGQIAAFHQRQLPNSWIDQHNPGKILGQLVNPVDAAGIYVPGGQGGKTPLVSSVLMCGIPAKIAGVKQLAMVTPPTADGSVSPHLLAAAQQVGIDAVYRVGSAWAVAALAYGTQTIPKVDVIAGPGNFWVTTAKKLVAGTVGIDMIAGPSEILIIADSSANPEFIAADLLSQAEHDPLASAVLITVSDDVAQGVQGALPRQLAALSRKSIAEKSISDYSAILKVPNMDTALELANRFAPEHLELQVENPFEYLGDIRNAGAVFMGRYTPEPVGDYIAGPNHVLPTSGTARFSSALSVEHFLKKTSLIHYGESAFQNEAQDIMRLARIEGLDAHANSIAVRLDKK